MTKNSFVEEVTFKKSLFLIELQALKPATLAISFYLF